MNLEQWRRAIAPFDEPPRSTAEREGLLTAPPLLGNVGEAPPRSTAEQVGGLSMTWQPGRPVVTAQDHADWQAWRKDRKRQQQRERRATNPRIDYYPSDEAHAIIGALMRPQAGHDLSSVINRIVTEWAAQCGATGIQ